jgi:hypothetical protein
MTGAPIDDLKTSIADAVKPWGRWQHPQITRKDVLASADKWISLLRSAKDHFSRAAVRRTRRSAREILAISTKLQRTQERASPEMKMRLKMDAAANQFDFSEIRRECEAAIRGTITTGRKDQIKLECARCSMLLILEHSDKLPASGSPKSPYRLIAGLLYEAATGIKESDFKRTCEIILAKYRPLIDGEKVRRESILKEIRRFKKVEEKRALEKPIQN